MNRLAAIGFCVGLAAGLPCALAAAQGDDPLAETALVLAPTESNPRNSEGDFVRLADGRILFVYTHYTGGSRDESTAHLAGRYSSDDGRTWTDEDVVVLPNEGDFNVMSVSLLRLADGRLGLFYLRKNAWNDCRPYLRHSDDEARTWSDPILCIPDEGYFVVNNDRVVQLESGRLVVPAADHTHYSESFTGRGAVRCYLSDDHGRTWRRGTTLLEGPADSKTGLQEPGVVQLGDGRLMMLCRTDQGCQVRSWSTDGGDTWSPVEPTDILSPVSPASIERLPGSESLLLVWNDHHDIAQDLRGKRTPLTVAVSKDGGRTWQDRHRIETDPHGWYCYTAIEFVEGHVLLAYCAGDARTDGLATTKIVRLPLDKLLRE